MIEDSARPPRSLYAWYVVAVLILAYTLSYVDRSILTLMVAPIRASLHISDVQLSLLHGLAFAIFYTIMGIPIGRLVDQRRRTGIVAVGVGLWSLATAACGFAGSFATMFAARIGVGVGEAALSPAAYSMLADQFEGKRLVRALSFYQSAIYLGPAIATLAGGVLLGHLTPLDTAIGHFEPWQLVFILVSLPGLAVALLVLTLREPARRGTGGQADAPPFRAVLRRVADHKGAYGLLILGLCFQSVMWNGAAAWIPTHFMRSYGWTPNQVAWGYGPAIAIAGTCGGVFGGWLAGRMRDKGLRDANIRIGVIAALTALPFIVAAPLMPTAESSLALVACFLFCGAMPYGGAAAAFQEITPNRMRGQVSAIYLFWLNLAGIGLGSTIVALATQHLFGGDLGVGRAIATVAGLSASLSAVTLMLCLAPYRRAMDRAGILK
ncbi:hypothetical protein ASG11_07720 [Sphingomonas sp. Leaf357]|uniref:spinster family MFS transporter n=1 Tax=Sphingomonas sp. Leaf357 TaxID=1736350 RepID=UPI0006FEC1C3|nr:MFS transporter [Sphingomonas sp. Leaf357]KQS04150.1 hypothetical protein ASG11_07720 [Sphingomonas sp. Leaf357]